MAAWGKWCTSMTIAAAGLLVVPAAPGSAETGCPAGAAEIVTIATVEPRLDLRLADGRVLRLVGVVPATATPSDPALGEAVRAGLAARIDARPVAVRITDPHPDRWGRSAALVFATGAEMAGPPGGLSETAIAAGLGRYDPEPAAHGCRDVLLDAERRARASRLGLWRDSFYGVLSAAAAERPALAARSSGFVVAEGRLTSIDAGPYRTKLTFASRDGQHRAALAAVIAPRVMKSFEKQGVILSSLIGRDLRVRGLLDIRFGPEVALTGPDALEILPSGEPQQASDTAGHG